MSEKLPDLNELFSPLHNTSESLRYSTDFTRELLAEFDTHRRKMHQELETQRKAVESGNPFPDEQATVEPISDDKNEKYNEVPIKPISQVKERKTGHKLKTIRKNILHMWRGHEVSNKDKASDMRRSKSCNVADKVDGSHVKVDRRSIFGTWKNFPFTTCTEDTTIDT